MAVKMSGINELEGFFELAESITYVQHCYEERLEDIKHDVLDLIEQVLQYGVMMIKESDERFDIVIGSLRQLIVAMKNETRSLR